jgi:hypothetical protein
MQALLLQDVARKKCSDIGSKHLVDLARGLSLDRRPQTVENYESVKASSMATPRWRTVLSIFVWPRSN